MVVIMMISIRSQMFFKIGVLKNFANFTGKHLRWSIFLTKLQALRSPTQLFSYEICELFKNTFFYRTKPVAASKNNGQQQISEGFANICYKIVSPILLEELN